MKTERIIEHLAEWLPKYSDKFTNSITPTAVSVSGSTVTVTSVAHGLSSNCVISVTDAELKLLVTTIDDSGTNVSMTVATDHDLTSGTPQDGDQKTVKLTSAVDPSIDDDYTLSYVPNRLDFEIPTFPDVALTDVYFNSSRTKNNINGVFDGLTIIDVDNFSYELPFTFAADPIVNASSAQVHTNIRIFGGATIERLLRLYNEQTVQELVGYVVLGDNATNKSRNVDTDDALNQGNLNDWNALYLSPFIFYVVVPCSENNTGLVARDTCEDIRAPLFQSLLGVSFATGFANDPMSAVYPVGDGVHAKRNGYYVHYFAFNQTAQISSDDVTYKPVTRAYREIEFDFANDVSQTGLVSMDAKINLDEDAN